MVRERCFASPPFFAFALRPPRSDAGSEQVPGDSRDSTTVPLPLDSSVDGDASADPEQDGDGITVGNESENNSGESVAATCAAADKPPNSVLPAHNQTSSKTPPDRAVLNVRISEVDGSTTTVSVPIKPCPLEQQPQDILSDGPTVATLRRLANGKLDNKELFCAGREQRLRKEEPLLRLLKVVQNSATSEQDLDESTHNAADSGEERRTFVPVGTTTRALQLFAVLRTARSNSENFDDLVAVARQHARMVWQRVWNFYTHRFCEDETEDEGGISSAEGAPAAGEMVREKESAGAGLRNTRNRRRKAFRDLFLADAAHWPFFYLTVDVHFHGGGEKDWVFRAV